MTSLFDIIMDQIQFELEQQIKLLETYKLIEMNELEQLIIKEKIKIKYAQKHPKSFSDALRPTQYFTLDIQILKYIEPIFNILKQFEERLNIHDNFIYNINYI
jgi:hypothetical protein